MRYMLFAICSLVDESQDMAAFADVTMIVVDDDDDDDEVMRERRTAGCVALSAAHCPVFEPLTYHTTPAAIQQPCLPCSAHLYHQNRQPGESGTKAECIHVGI